MQDFSISFVNRAFNPAGADAGTGSGPADGDMYEDMGAVVVAAAGNTYDLAHGDAKAAGSTYDLGHGGAKTADSTYDLGYGGAKAADSTYDLGKPLPPADAEATYDLGHDTAGIPKAAAHTLYLDTVPVIDQKLVKKAKRLLLKKLGREPTGAEIAKKAKSLATKAVAKATATGNNAQAAGDLARPGTQIGIMDTKAVQPADPSALYDLGPGVNTTTDAGSAPKKSYDYDSLSEEEI